MSIRAVCPCGKAFQADDRLAGRRVRCPQCGQAFTVPHAAGQGLETLGDSLGEFGANAASPLGGSTTFPSRTLPPRRRRRKRLPAVPLVAAVGGIVLVVIIAAAVVLSLSSRDGAKPPPSSAPDEGTASLRIGAVKPSQPAVSAASEPAAAEPAASGAAEPAGPVAEETIKPRASGSSLDSAPRRYGFTPETDLERGELARYVALTLGGIDHVDFSPDGSRVLAGTRDGHVGLFDAGTWRLIPREGVDPRPRKPPSGATYIAPAARAGPPRAGARGESPTRLAVRVVRFCPDGEHALTAIEFALYHWELATGNTVHTFDFPTRILQAVYSPDGRFLAAFGFVERSGDAGSLVHVWDVASGAVVSRCERLDLSLRDIQFAEDGKTLCLLHFQGVEWVDTASGETRARYPTPLLQSAKLDVPHDRFFSTGMDPTRQLSPSAKQLAVWDLAAGRVRTRIDPAVCTGDVIRVTRDGRLAAVGLRERVAIWDLQQNTVVDRLPELRGGLRDMAVHPDGVQLVTVAHGLRVWQIPGLSRPPAPTVAAAPPEQPAPDQTSPSAEGLRKVVDFQVPEVHAHFIAFSPDDSLVALPTRSLTGIMLCRTSDGEAVRGRPFEGTPGVAIWHVAFSGDGKCLISGDVQGKVTVWDAATGQPSTRLEGHTKKIERVSLSHDGSVALSCNSDLSRPEVFVWDVASARRLRELTGHQSGILAAVLLPEDKAVTVDKTVAVLWNVETGQPAGSVTLAARAADQLSSATLSRDGMFVLVGRPSSIELWDLAAGKPLCVVPDDALRAHNLRNPLALSPDHRLMLCSDAAGGLVVWDLVQNRRKALLERAPAGYGSNAAFSRDGRRIVTAGLEHLTLWELLDSPADRE